MFNTITTEKTEIGIYRQVLKNGQLKRNLFTITESVQAIPLSIVYNARVRDFFQKFADFVFQLFGGFSQLKNTYNNFLDLQMTACFQIKHCFFYQSNAAHICIVLTGFRFNVLRDSTFHLRCKTGSIQKAKLHLLFINQKMYQKHLFEHKKKVG